MSQGPAVESKFLFHRVWIDESVEVAAPLADVQALLEDIRDWPSWTPGLTKLRISAGEPVHQGSRFLMQLKMRPLPKLWLPCVVFVYRRGHVEWGGGGLGSVIRHRFEITELDAGRTQVRHVEYATNLLALLLRPLEKAIRGHDSRWTKAIGERFGVAA